ncbi:MAG: hypothetical protein Q7S44_03820 [bacterium]|nr:hypothetical protein [bacterium]
MIIENLGLTARDLAKQVSEVAPGVCVETKLGTCTSCRVPRLVVGLQTRGLSEGVVIDEVVAEVNRVCCKPLGGQLRLSAVERAAGRTKNIW